MTTKLLEPLRVLEARAEARAILYQVCEYDLEEALQPLYDYARDSGLIDELGCDVVLCIIHKPFGL